MLYEKHEEQTSNKLSKTKVVIGTDVLLGIYNCVRTDSQSGSKLNPIHLKRNLRHMTTALMLLFSYNACVNIKSTMSFDDIQNNTIRVNVELPMWNL